MAEGWVVNYIHTVTDNATEVDSDGNNSTTNTFYMVNTIAPIYPLHLRDGNGNIMTDDNGKIYDYGNGMNAGLNRPVLSQLNLLKDDQLQASHSVGNTFGINGFADITPTFVKGLKNYLERYGR